MTNNEVMISKLYEVRDVFIRRILAISNSAVLNLILLVEEASNSEILKNVTSQIEAIHKYIPEEIKQRAKYKGEAVHNFLLSSYFISLMSYTEYFLYDFQKIILEHYPLKIKNFNIESKEIIAIDNSTRIKSYIIEKYLDRLFYESPKEYKSVLFKIISADENLLKDEWGIFVEMKARRDLGVHNNWFKNSRYIEKLNIFNIDVPTDNYLIPNQEYLGNCIAVLGRIATGLCEHCSSKFVNNGM